MKIFMGSDHGGFELKQQIKAYLETKNYEVIDEGTLENESVDYPCFGAGVATMVTNMDGSLGIVVCGSGIGISIAANKIKGSRCALCNSVELATLARQHNGANILALGERTTFIDDWEKVVKAFLETKVDESDRHARRRDQLDQLIDNA